MSLPLNVQNSQASSCIVHKTAKSKISLKIAVVLITAAGSAGQPHSTDTLLRREELDKNSECNCIVMRVYFGLGYM